jgi:hypothetical protein
MLENLDAVGHVRHGYEGGVHPWTSSSMRFRLLIAFRDQLGRGELQIWQILTADCPLSLRDHRVGSGNGIAARCTRRDGHPPLPWPLHVRAFSAHVWLYEPVLSGQKPSEGSGLSSRKAKRAPSSPSIDRLLHIAFVSDRDCLCLLGLSDAYREVRPPRTGQDREHQ